MGWYSSTFGSLVSYKLFSIFLMILLEGGLSKILFLLIERLFIDEKVQALGDRRYAWIFPYDCEIEYEEEEAHAKIKFSLPKGSYATSLLEEITGAELGGGGDDFFEE